MAKEDLKKVDAAAAAQPAEEELSEDELDAVAGGGYCFIAGCGANAFCAVAGNWDAKAQAEADTKNAVAKN